MSEVRRPYRSDLRDRQARETRRAVVAAATELFLAHGYADTTLDAVAAAAGVSRRTVFNAVGGKAALLSLAHDWSLVGDDDPVPMAARPEIARIQAATDPHEAIGLWAAKMVEVLERSAPIERVLEVAADVDAEIAALREKSAADRLEGARAFAAGLAAIGGLGPGVTVERAADAIWAFNDGGLYRRLVLERGWSRDAFRAWLAGQVERSCG